MALVPPSAGSAQPGTTYPQHLITLRWLTRRRLMSSPFPIPACVAHVSRFGVIPKNHQPNKWWLIFYFSHPKGYSVNDGIPKELCSMSYITTDDAVCKIEQLGPGSLLAKIDIKSAFRLIPVDRHLLAMLWRGSL